MVFDRIWAQTLLNFSIILVLTRLRSVSVRGKLLKIGKWSRGFFSIFFCTGNFGLETLSISEFLKLYFRCVIMWVECRFLEFIFRRPDWAFRPNLDFSFRSDLTKMFAIFLPFSYCCEDWGSREIISEDSMSVLHLKKSFHFCEKQFWLSFRNFGCTGFQIWG